jgi:hypothetical protein
MIHYAISFAIIGAGSTLQKEVPGIAVVCRLCYMFFPHIAIQPICRSPILTDHTKSHNIMPPSEIGNVTTPSECGGTGLHYHCRDCNRTFHRQENRNSHEYTHWDLQDYLQHRKTHTHYDCRYCQCCSFHREEDRHAHEQAHFPGSVQLREEPREIGNTTTPSERGGIGDLLNVIRLEEENVIHMLNMLRVDHL